jgi:hypothetical protein
MFLVGPAILVEQYLLRVHACVVRLVIDEQKRQIGHNPAAGFLISSVGDMVAYPAQ